MLLLRPSLEGGTGDGEEDKGAKVAIISHKRQVCFNKVSAL